MAINQNYNLSATGIIYEGNVKSLNAIDLYIDDNGGGSTVTIESSADDAAWGAYTYVYSLATGQPVALGGSTLTAKGRYWIDTSAINYIRIRVSTYVSGYVLSRVEESTVALRSVLQLLATGLVAQGTTQAGALPIQAEYNQFATVAASAGTILPSNLPRNSKIEVRNSGANALAIYPIVGGAINGGAVNTAVSLAAGAATKFISDGVGGFWQF